MHPDHEPYYHLSSNHRLIKSIDILVGIIEGIEIDHKINPKEIEFLENWINSQGDLKNRHPYNELIPVIENSIKDHILTTEEKNDIIWLCQIFTKDDTYARMVTRSMRNLHGILAGIISDGIITVNELSGLQDWIMEHEFLKTCWPYDEIDSLITIVLADKKIDSEEQKTLLQWFAEFIPIEDEQVISAPLIEVNGTITGVCAVSPEIIFQDKIFCLTGASHKYKRSDFSDLINQYGGIYSDSMTKEVDYLVVGSEGNPCWQYSCYGRKVEKAVNLRKSGSNLLIIHENDFHDAILDLQ